MRGIVVSWAPAGRCRPSSCSSSCSASTWRTSPPPSRRSASTTWSTTRSCWRWPAAGLTFVVLSGELDLSGSGVIAIANVVVATTSTGTLGSIGSLGAVLGVGLLVGALNGWLVAYLGLQSLAVTIGSLIVCQGVAPDHPAGTRRRGRGRDRLGDHGRSLRPAGRRDSARDRRPGLAGVEEHPPGHRPLRGGRR